jgi:hypothetical protein
VGRDLRKPVSSGGSTAAVSGAVLWCAAGFVNIFTTAAAGLLQIFVNIAATAAGGGFVNILFTASVMCAALFPRCHLCPALLWAVPV